MDFADQFRDGRAGGDWIGGEAEKAGELQPPEEFFVGFAEEIFMAFGLVCAGEPADVGVGPEGWGDCGG